MNLAKAFVLCSRQREEVNNAQHGLSEKLDPPPNDVEMVNAWLSAERTPLAGPALPPNQKIKVFDELLFAISAGHIPAATFRFDLMSLLPQVVPGHRLWVEGGGGGEDERFISIEHIEFIHDVALKQIWLRLFVYSDDLKRVDVSHGDFLNRARLDNDFHEVRLPKQIDDRPLLCFEQLNPVTYNHRPSDQVPELVASIRHRLWRTVLTAPPYRKYYAYAAPITEHPQVLPQILTIYAVTFYLGSIVRYRPHHFDKILQGSYGPFVEAFLNDQPTQLIYLFASEFAEKEVTKAAIV